MRQYRLAYPETFRGGSAPAGELRTVGLLLNGLSLNGVQFTGFEAYIAGVRRIAGWCREHGMALKLRGRPGDPMTTAMAEATGLSRQTLAEGLSESLADFAASVDICLMYDAPTSADLEFLRNGVALLNPVPEPLYCAEAMQANASVVPRDDVEARYRRAMLLVDALEAWFRLRRQFYRGPKQSFAWLKEHERRSQAKSRSHRPSGCPEPVQSIW